MLNQLLKFTLVSSLLLWLKPRWRGLLVLCGTVVLVHVLHGEYLGYVELSGDRSLLVWSYVIKWAALVLAAITYLLFVLSGSGRRSPASPRSVVDREASSQSANADDGFDFLRNKKALRSRADLVITGKSGADNER